MSQLAGVRLLDLGRRPVARRAAARIPHRHRASLRGRRRPRLRRRRAASIRGASAALDAADPDAGPVVLRGPDAASAGCAPASAASTTPAACVHIGNPEEASVAHYNFPARPTERYGVHDRAALIPAELVSFGGRWEDGRYLLEAVGRVTQAQTYGENLVLDPHLPQPAIGASWFTMEDVVENAGFLPTEHMLLYHFNIGYPVRRRGRRAHRAGRRPAAAVVRHRRRGGPRRAGPASSRRRRTGCSRPSSTACGPMPTARWRSRSSTRGSSAAPR